MAGTLIRNLGTTATMAPVIKRGVGTFSDGKAISLTIDTNLAASGGTDVTGVAKFVIHTSGDASRTTFPGFSTYTPTVAPSSSTRYAVASMAVSDANITWVAYQGVDNSLRVIRWSYSGGLGSPVETVVQAAGAITNRFRSIDIDVVGTQPVIIAYEAVAADGNGSAHRVYALMTDNTTWRRVLNIGAVPGGTYIRAGSEDVTIAGRGDGIVSNVIRFVIYGTKTSTTADYGDVLREYSFNVSSGAADSGTLLGSWFIDLNKSVAAGTRRALLFTISANLWVLAGAYGTASPKFFATKLTTGNHTKPGFNYAGYVASAPLSAYFKMDPSVNARTYWSATYRDNRLSFGFIGVGAAPAPRLAREIVFTWPNVSQASAKPTIDSVPRPLDGNRYLQGGPIGIYAGENRRISTGLKAYNYTISYGPAGNVVNPTTLPRVFFFVAEDTFLAPITLSPTLGGQEASNYPTYRVRVDNLNLTPNLYGKIEIQVSTDNTFVLGTKTITQPDSAYQYFGTKDGLAGANKTVTVATPSAATALSTAVWYWRARVVSDKDTPGAWSDISQFAVYHPPSALPIRPSPAQLLPGLAQIFSWSFSDTEKLDSQSAYRLLITNESGLTNTDTGWVTSSAKQVGVTFNSGLLEVPQVWTVQLRDNDVTTGPQSNPIEFMVGTPPTAVINNYSNNDPVLTAAPTFVWTFTGSGGRLQKAYRVSIVDVSGRGTQRNANPDFEVDTNNWTAFGSTKNRSTVYKHTGIASMYMTPDGVSVTARVESEKVPGVSPGEQWIAQSWVFSPVGRQMSMNINWFDSDGNYQSTSTGPNIILVANTWTYISTTATAPGGSGRCSITINEDTTPAVGDILYIDEARIGTTVELTASYYTVTDTSWITSPVTAHAFTNNVLQNGSNYNVTLQTMDDGGLTSTSIIRLNGDWFEPDLASFTATVDKFKVRIEWDEGTRDDDWVSYRVYRRYMKVDAPELDITGSQFYWELLYETDEVLIDYVYDDYLAPLNTSVDYVVVQVADRFGSLLESNIYSFTTIVQSSDRYFFVPQIPVGTIATFEAGDVVADQFTREIEQEVLHVIGRGRQVQIGDDLGYSGSLQLHLRNPATARLTRQFLEMLTFDHNSVYIKSPFGDVVLAALQSVQTTRLGGYGDGDIVDLSVPYTQIIDVEKVTRAG